MSQGHRSGKVFIVTPKGMVSCVDGDDAQDIEPFEFRPGAPAGPDDPYESSDCPTAREALRAGEATSVAGEPVKTDRPGVPAGLGHAMEPETSGFPGAGRRGAGAARPHDEPDITRPRSWVEPRDVAKLKKSIRKSSDYVTALKILRDHQRDDQKTGEPEPARLDTNDVVELPVLFQPRGGREVDPYHVDALAKTLRNGQELDPIRVLPVARILIVFDGHHRLAAYRKLQRRTIPVVIEPMPVDMAVLEAGRANSPDKLGMTPSQKSEFAWRLVIARVGRQIDIAKATGRSDRSVRTMMSARDKLERRSDIKLQEIYWFQARRIYQGEDPTDVLGDNLSSKEIDVEALATEWSVRLRKTFGKQPGKQPEAFARALEQAMPQAIDRIIEALQECRGDDPDEYDPDE